MPFSRPFIQSTTSSPGDDLQRRDMTPAAEICKTSFIAKKVRDFLDLNANIAYVRIDTVTPSPGTQKFFRMLACNNVHQVLHDLVGHLPCPDECVPPEPPFLPRENTFDIGDLNDVLAFPGITHVNVHSAIRHDTIHPQETHSIYAITGWPENPVAHHGPGKPAFTSTTVTP